MQHADFRQSVGTSDGPGFAELMARLRGSGRFIMVGGLFGIVAAAIWLALFHYFNPKMVTYNAAIRFEAKGGKTGHYPNGLEFSPQDIRSPSVIDAVHKSLLPQKSGLTLEDLDSMILIAPFSPERELVRNKFVRTLGDKNLTAAERTELEQDYAQALKDAGPDGTMISLTAKARDLPDQSGAAIVQSLLDNWSRIFITEYGVANQPATVHSKILIEARLIESEDYPIAFRRLEAAASELRARAAVLSDLPGTEGITTDERTIRDVLRDAAEIEQFRIRETLAPLAYGGLSRDADATTRTLGYIAQTIRDTMTELGSQSQIIDDLLEQTQIRAARSGAPGSAETANANISQLGDSAAERLIELAVSNADRPFIQELMREKQEIGVKLAATATNLRQVERLAGALGNTPAGQDQASAELFSNTVKTATADLNRLWAELNTLANLASSMNLNPARTLYSRIPVGEELTVSGGFSDPRGWGVAIVLLALAVAAGLLAHVIRGAFKQPELPHLLASKHAELAIAAESIPSTPTSHRAKTA